MDDTQRNHKADLLWNHRRRLNVLEEKEAKLGINASPEIINEIEDIRAKIARLEADLNSTARVENEQTFGDIATPVPSNFLIPESPQIQKNNLPVQPTPLIGRSLEIAAACALLRRQDLRLLTLTGSGGIGKTRLALQVAAELLNDFTNGVCLVALAPISDPKLVVSMIAKALDVRETGEAPLVETITGYLRDRELLLLLDNFEQVIGAAPLVGQLLAGAARLKVLVTSRAVLHLAGEQEFLVPPLTLPDRKNLPPVDHLAVYDSVELFVKRAQAVRMDFVLTSANAPKVAEICHRLEGLPLAIELAAARVKLLSPEALLIRLNAPLKLLIGGARNLAPHQQTLRNTIDWSYHLIDADGQMLLQRMAVFVGGFTLTAVESVCSGPPDLSVESIDVVADLVDNSMVHPGMISSTTLRETAADPLSEAAELRFFMLELIREYALERLMSNGEADLLRDRHAEFFLQLAETAEPELIGSQQEVWLVRLEREHDNLRAALAWLMGKQEIELVLRLSGALWRFWYAHGYLSEGRKWLEGSLARVSSLGESPSPPSMVRAKALNGAGNLAFRQGDHAQATIFHEESLALCRALGNMSGVSISLNNLGVVAHDQGDYLRAIAIYEESLMLCRELGDRWGVAGTLMNLGAAAVDRGDPAGATTYYEESLEMWRALEDQGSVAFILTSLATVALDQGDYIRASILYKEGLTFQRDVGDKVGIAYCLEGLAGVACEERDAVRAARLLGAAAALRDAIGAPVSPSDRSRYDRIVAAVKAQLDTATYLSAWNAGRLLSLQQAIAEALAERPLPA